MRALIRAALNERALERYILTWLGDTIGLLARFESWALVRDNEACNLLPSIAAGMNINKNRQWEFSPFIKYNVLVLKGLGTILFAITVDSPELNIISPAETKCLQKPNEIIIAVPVVGAKIDTITSAETKMSGSKRKQIISFEDDEMESVSSHSSSSIKSPTLSLSDACLKYEEKEKQRNESIQAICNDSSYQRIMNLSDPTPHCVDKNATPIETGYIQPEAPQKIELYSPVLSAKTYQTTYSSIKIDSGEFDVKEFESNISTKTDSRSFASTTTTTSSSSTAAQRSPSNPSQSSSMSSSISSVPPVTESNSATNARLQELESRCASLEEQITTLTLLVFCELPLNNNIMSFRFKFSAKMLASNRCTTI